MRMVAERLDCHVGLQPSRKDKSLRKNGLSSWVTYSRYHYEEYTYHRHHEERSDVVIQLHGNHHRLNSLLTTGLPRRPVTSSQRQVTSQTPTYALFAMTQ